MWQNNISWHEGLFAEIPFRRFQTIKTTQWDSPLAIFTRLNSDKGNDWGNLRLAGIQQPSSPPIRALDTLFSPEYYIVAIDTRVKTTECVIDIKTQDSIRGSIRVNVEYQVNSLETLLVVDDPLARLKDRVADIVQDFVSRKDFFSIEENGIEQGLQSLEAREQFGLNIRRFFNLQIIWAESIAQKYQKSVIDRLDDKTQRNFNELKAQKLKDLGINDPLLIVSVLSKSDSDFNIIINYVRHASQAHKDQMERDLSLLSWLKEKDLLTRSDIQDVIDSLTERINNQVSLSLSLPNELLSNRRPPGDELVDAPAPEKKKKKGKSPDSGEKNV